MNREHSPHFTCTPRARLRRAVHTCSAKTRGKCAKKGRMAAAAAADDDDDDGKTTTYLKNIQNVYIFILNIKNSLKK